MDLLNEYGTDPDLEAAGVWCDDFKGGVEMKIRSSQSPEYRAAVKRIGKRNERYVKLDQDVPEDLVRKNLVDLASAAVADWRVRTKLDGKADIVAPAIPFGGTQIECTDENKKLIFSDKRLWSLRANVIAKANDITRFELAATEEDAKNSLTLAAPVSNSEPLASAS